MGKKQFFSKKQKEMKEIAEKRIIYLFGQAKDIFSKSPELADRYVAIARKILMKHKVKIPRELKRKFCKHCYKYLVPGRTCRVRTHKGKVVYSCFNCKKYMRFVINSR
jgi:ribonuclease P protein subunit RPR2